MAKLQNTEIALFSNLSLSEAIPCVTIALIIMPISGLAITFTEDAGLRRSALEALRHHHAIALDPTELGQRRIPIVVDTDCSEEDRLVWEWLRELPGVQFIDVVYIHFEESPNSIDPELIA